jgi:hypothetical protein
MQPDTNQAKFTMLVMKFAFVASGFLFIYVVIKLPAQAQQPVSPAFELTITILALANAVLGFFGREFFGRIAKRTSSNGQGQAPLNPWMVGNLARLACIEACILLGVVLHFVGARVRFVELPIGVGLTALLLWSPGAPPGTEGVSPSQG